LNEKKIDLVERQTKYTPIAQNNELRAPKYKGQIQHAQQMIGSFLPYCGAMHKPINAST